MNLLDLTNNYGALVIINRRGLYFFSVASDRILLYLEVLKTYD